MVAIMQDIPIIHHFDATFGVSTANDIGIILKVFDIGLSTVVRDTA